MACGVVVMYNCRMVPRGIYRIKNGWANQHSVMVQYDDVRELEIPEDQYREQGYQPPFDSLSWDPPLKNYMFGPP